MDLYQYGPPPPMPVVPLARKPRKKLYIGIGIGAGLVVTGLVILSCFAGVKLLSAGFRDPSRAMAFYTDALIRKDYQGAYKMASPAFREGFSYDDLLSVHKKLTDEFGALKAVKQTYWHAETKNGISTSTIQANFQFERSSQMFEFVLERENGTWLVYSYKQL